MKPLYPRTVIEGAKPVALFSKGYGERLHELDRVGRSNAYVRIHDDGSAEMLAIYA